jgi:hypothetical protein
MKSEAGWAAAALVAVAAYIGINSQPGGRPASDQAATARTAGTARPSAGAVRGDFDQGPCVEIESKLQTFLLSPAEGVAAPGSCYSKGKRPEPGHGKSDLAADALRSKARNLRFAIAVLPDPVHTHFALSFDRLVEAIQQGAQDERYFYDSSWLPWEREDGSLALLDDQDKADERSKARENQPGILLFRAPRGAQAEVRPPISAAQQNDPADSMLPPYKNGLVVFVVGEEPTSGIHKRQFENAVAWIAALQAASGGIAPSVPGRADIIGILGPTFSGSLPSLAQMLAEGETSLKSAFLDGSDASQPLRIFSGNVTSDSAVAQFQQEIGSDHVEFRSFQASDDTLLSRYRTYLFRQGFDISRLAIISEDETAYGGYVERAGPDPICGRLDNEGDELPACLYYPRDISALRDAYQKQSIFNAGGTQAADAGRRTLDSDVADPEGKEHDTIRDYSGQQTPLSQEAVLQQIVSMLRAHQSEYVVLRSSNPLDQLFLAHYLRLAYPEGRVVIQGADLLLRRESGAATLSGIMTLTTYPLLPWEGHWTAVERTDPADPVYSHSHRVFAQDLAEGNYMATRALLEGAAFAGSCAADAAVDDFSAQKLPEFLPPNCGTNPIRDYVAPFWVNGLCANGARACASARRPSTWLSVLGRDGFWPVAALNPVTLPQTPPQSSRIGKFMDAVISLPRDLLYLLPPWWGYPINTPSNIHWPPMPLTMKFCLVAILVWAGFHFMCCLRPSLTVKPGHRAHFARVPGLSHPVLVLFGSFMIAVVPILLAWGYGSMSEGGEPLPHPWLYRIYLPVVWLLAGLAVLANDVVETYLGPRRDAWAAAWMQLRASGARRVGLLAALRRFLTQLRPWPWRWSAGYLLLTLFFYSFVDFWLENALNSANRIPTYWRSMNIANGASPLLPLLSIAVGFYFWFWHSLQGLAMFGGDRPLLPREADLESEWPDRTRHGTMRMFSAEAAGWPIEKASLPFAREFLAAVLLLAAGLWITGYCLAGFTVPIRSLGHQDYAIFVCLGLVLSVSLMLGNAWQLLRIWIKLRQLLVFLDRMPLRRTLEDLKGYSWGSVWKMGGNVLDVRWKLLSRQMETLTHLWNCPMTYESDDAPGWYNQIFKTLKIRGAFADRYSKSWDDWTDRDLSLLTAFQESAAKTTAMLLSEVLLTRWRSEDKSLVMEEREDKSTVVDLPEKRSLLIGRSGKNGKPLFRIWGEDDAGRAEDPGDKLPEYIRNAEELVCLVYLGFIQNVLGRMRTLVMQLLCLFLAAALAVATYPFDPRPALSGAMLVLFIVIGVVIVIVYSQMHRDATLSHVTNTQPGELGTEFWFKLIGFGIGPLLGLLATIFPEVTGSLFSWLQPGLTSIK